MDRFKETYETWNKVAKQYQEKFMDIDLYNDSYDFICKSLPKTNSKILEIGCGPGNITRYLLAKRPDFMILGIDIAPNMIELAMKNNPSASFEVMDCRQISKLTRNFDGVIGGFCLPYLSETDSAKLISESYNLLNNNGLLYLSFVDGDPGKSDFQVGSSGDKIYFYYHNSDELKTQLKNNKFREIEIFRVVYKKSKTEIELHTILTAKKM